VAADLGDAEATRRALSELERRLGGAPDIVVNAAGVFSLAPIAETELEVLDLNLDVNLRGTFLVLRHFLPRMLERGSGRIVNVGSVGGWKAFPSNGAYSASKFGLRGFHDVLVEETRGTGVSATLVEPGACDTSIWDPFHPDSDPGLPDRAAMLRPEQVAEVILFAATRAPDLAIPLLRMERA
jgi:NAD(P)-dependent dehydrogenase (short-subunit alcohol dehydrogenase family)